MKAFIRAELYKKLELSLDPYPYTSLAKFLEGSSIAKGKTLAEWILEPELNERQLRLYLLMIRRAKTPVRLIPDSLVYFFKHEGIPEYYRDLNVFLQDLNYLKAIGFFSEAEMKFIFPMVEYKRNIKHALPESEQNSSLADSFLSYPPYKKYMKILSSPLACSNNDQDLLLDRELETPHIANTNSNIEQQREFSASEALSSGLNFEVTSSSAQVEAGKELNKRKRRRNDKDEKVEEEAQELRLRASNPLDFSTKNLNNQTTFPQVEQDLNQMLEVITPITQQDDQRKQAHLLNAGFFGQRALFSLPPTGFSSSSHNSERGGSYEEIINSLDSRSLLWF